MALLRIRGWINREQSKRTFINTTGDHWITVAFVLLETLGFVVSVPHDVLSVIYFVTLFIYTIYIFLVIKVQIFSGVGLFCVYLLLFVQSGFLMQFVYNPICQEAHYVVIAYNVLAPVLLSILKSRIHHTKTQLKHVEFKEIWLELFFYVGVASMIVYYVSAGFIPLFAEDGENARVAAMAGRGKFVVLASNCFTFAILLTKSKVKRVIRLALSVLLLIGTGYRSSALELLLLLFIVFIIGNGRKYIAKGIAFVILLCFLYSIIGVLRSNTAWSWVGLYKPMLWRFYVNSSNLGVIIERFPKNQFMLGKAFIQDISVLLPGAQDTFMTQLKTIMNYQFPGGSLTPTLFGEGYYNWSYLGAVFWPLFILTLVVLLDDYIKYHFDGRIYYIFAYSLLGFTTSSFIPVMVNTYVPTLILCFVLMKFGRVSNTVTLVPETSIE